MRAFLSESFPESPVNLGNPIEFTMLELAKLVIDKIQSNSKIAFRVLPKDDPRQRKPDIRLAQELLNWEPTTDLSIGLDQTIIYFQGLLSK